MSRYLVLLAGGALLFSPYLAATTNAQDAAKPVAISAPREGHSRACSRCYIRDIQIVGEALEVIS